MLRSSELDAALDARPLRSWQALVHVQVPIETWAESLRSLHRFGHCRLACIRRAYSFDLGLSGTLEKIPKILGRE